MKELEKFPRREASRSIWVQHVSTNAESEFSSLSSLFFFPSSLSSLSLSLPDLTHFSILFPFLFAGGSDPPAQRDRESQGVHQTSQADKKEIT